jgi:hypothetical protein
LNRGKAKKRKGESERGGKENADVDEVIRKEREKKREKKKEGSKGRGREGDSKNVPQPDLLEK